MNFLKIKVFHLTKDFQETDHWKVLSKAHGFLSAADVLRCSEEYGKSRILFSPALHLLAHGVELQLKANLIGGGRTLNELRKTYGHNVWALWECNGNQLFRATALREAEVAWQRAIGSGKWPDQFSEDPRELLEQHLRDIDELHTAKSEYALRYLAKSGALGPRVHLLVDTFLAVSRLCIGQPDLLIKRV